MEFGACFGVIWTLCVLSFQYSEALSIPAYASPLALYVLMAIFLLNPTKTFRHEARFWTIRVLWRIFLAPFYYVSFADFFVADQLNSIVPAFLDLQFLICFYWNNPSWDIPSQTGECSSTVLFDSMLLNFNWIFLHLHRSGVLRGRIVSHSADGGHAARIFSFCPVHSSVSWYTRSISASSQRTQIFDGIFCCHFFIAVIRDWFVYSID